LILLTDGMFSHDGSAAPLDRYLEILPADAVLLVDDAHGAGVVGKNGRGTPEHAGIGRKRVIQTITLSKAFGVYGGAILGSGQLQRRIAERSHLFVGSTPLPLPLANAALESVRILKAEPSLRERLRQNTNYVRSRLRDAGLPVADAPGPIIALVPAKRAVSRLKAVLLKAAIYPPFIRYPGGPAAGYFRFVISSEHSREQLDSLISALSMRCDSARSNGFRDLI
jgi:7-keto-8-aminopelargonate synthetase-like enzyme